MLAARIRRRRGAISSAISAASAACFARSAVASAAHTWQYTVGTDQGNGNGVPC